jgi:hypothetical protein
MKTFFITSDFPLFSMAYIDQIGAEPAKYGLQIQAENVSDGYHTMHELYQHRMALNVALFNKINDFPLTFRDYLVIKSKLHSDGTMFDGYFIVMLITPTTQISYHYDLKHWDLFEIPEVERAPKYDGHSSNDVIERLLKL